MSGLEGEGRTGTLGVCGVLGPGIVLGVPAVQLLPGGGEGGRGVE